MSEYKPDSNYHPTSFAGYWAQAQPSDIARWDLTTLRLHQHGQLTIIPDVMRAAEGDWVRYDDIASLLEYRAEILVALLEESTYDGLYARLMDLHEIDAVYKASMVGYRILGDDEVIVSGDESWGFLPAPVGSWSPASEDHQVGRTPTTCLSAFGRFRRKLKEA